MAASVHSIVVNLIASGVAKILSLLCQCMRSASSLCRALSLDPHLNLFGLPNMTGLVRSILGMGNPLLDVSAVIDEKFLEKYGVCGSCHEALVDA